MMPDKIKTELFVGVRITPALQRHFDESESGQGHLLEGKSERSLQKVTIGSEEIMGRAVAQGATVDSLVDIVRNLRSILLRYVPRYPLKDSEIKIYAIALTSRY
jgi:exo-beta-1,3-glucanase (GH17 family)